jgi:hypothetical protein
VAADIVVWDGASTNSSVFGVFARGTPATIASGVFDAATMTVEINRFADAAGSRGRSQVIAFSAGMGGGPATLAECTLVPGRKYRLTFYGVGNAMVGAVYDLEDLTRPILYMTGDDFFASLGLYGGPFPDPTLGGYSGLITFSSLGTSDTTVFGGGCCDPTTDTTFDNFVASEFPPTNLVAFPGTPHGLAGVPQVVNRSPVSFKNFHPASSGITFNATTLTTTNTVNTAAIKLYLNGVDVSTGLIITGPTTNASVSFPGLVSNVVYEARIELQDALGRKTTNAWTFDTFSDAYLASSRSKNIECEDFDYLIGQFIDDPPPSGYATNDYFPITSLTTAYNSGVGYLDLDGQNDVDFYDRQGAPEAQESDFRFFDAPGTTAGTVTHSYGDPAYPGSILFYRNYDTQRQKYSNVNSNLYDYVLMRTEGGEWLNYTRIFTNAAYYNVYLRYNSGLFQPLSLDQIGAGPTTNNLGTFAVKSSAAMGNYRYAPMLNGGGNLAVVNLSGQNTLRLTMTGPQNGSTKQRTALNYLAFVPALVVESAAQVGGPYTIETGAAVEPGSRRITVPASGGTRFYRLGWDRAVTITSVNLVGGNVVMTYQ